MLYLILKAKKMELWLEIRMKLHLDNFSKILVELSWILLDQNLLGIMVDFDSKGSQNVWTEPFVMTYID